MSTGLVILFSVLAGAAVGCFIVVRRKKNGRRDVTSWKMIPFRKLDFSKCDVLTNLREDDVIGTGGSGKVYRIQLPGRGGAAGTVVAVQKLWSRWKTEEKLYREFDTEVKILGDIRHANIVSLLCYISSDDGAKLLVYEYMENGSLDRWLHPRDKDDGAAAAALDWPTRLGIAMDAARGLSYMHDECAQPIMHRDVKSSNILLDPAFHAKIAGFGLARTLRNSGEPESVSAVGGTFGYMAPECGRGAKVNQKVDVYSFGVVLLELVTGRVANDGSEDAAGCCLVEWAWRRYKAGGPLHDVVDGSMPDRAVYAEDAVAAFVLGVICTGDDAESRPSMKLVLQQLARYDRPASVAGACRDVELMGQLPDGNPMAGLPPVSIVLAMGSAVVGGPQALRLLLALEGRTAAADVTICVFLFCTLTALVLGTLLLARFLRDADAHPSAAGAPTPGTERFARLTFAVALAVLFLVTTCLLVVPTSPAGTGLGGARSCSA